jgi:hypothetical protein
VLADGLQHAVQARSALERRDNSPEQMTGHAESMLFECLYLLYATPVRSDGAFG